MAGFKQFGFNATIRKVILALACTFSPFLWANFTLPLNPSNPIGATPLQQHTGYSSSSSFDDQFKKRPPWGGSQSSIQDNIWLVPVLRYLIMVDGKSITMKTDAMIVLVPVILETAANWWFHEDQVLERINQQGETPVGDPIPINHYPVDGGDGNQEKPNGSGSSEGATAKDAGKGSQSAGGGHSVSTHRPSDDGNGKKDRLVHRCGEKCPACNGELCHCDECQAEEKRRSNKRGLPDSYSANNNVPLKKRKEEEKLNTSRRAPEQLHLQPEVEHRLESTASASTSPRVTQRPILPLHQQSIVRLLLNRELGVIDHFQQEHLAVFSQQLLRHEVMPIEISASAVNAEYLGSLPDGRFIIRGRKGSSSRDSPSVTWIKPYQNVNWSSIEILVYLNDKSKVVVIIDQHQFLSFFKGLLLWTEKEGGWSAVFLDSSTEMAVTSDKKIITRGHDWEKDLTTIHVWSEQNQLWSSETFYSDLYIGGAADSDNLILPLNSHNRILTSHTDGSHRVWFRQDGTWLFSALPTQSSQTGAVRKTVGMLELDNRTVAIYSSSHLGIWRETDGQWVYTELASDLKLTGRKPIHQLQKGCLVARKPSQSGIKTWVEQDGIWQQIILDSQIKIESTAALEGNRFIAWSRNSVTIWSLTHHGWQAVPLPVENTEVGKVFPLRDGRFLLVPDNRFKDLELWHEIAGEWSVVKLRRPHLPMKYGEHGSFAVQFSLLNDGRLIGTFLYQCLDSGCLDEPGGWRRRERSRELIPTRAFYIWDLFPRPHGAERVNQHYERWEGAGTFMYEKLEEDEARFRRRR